MSPTTAPAWSAATRWSSKSVIEPATVQALTDFTLDNNYGILTVCGLETCYVNERDRGYDEFFRTFYHKIEYVETLDHLPAEVNKFTIFFPGENAVAMRDEVYGPGLGRAALGHLRRVGLDRHHEPGRGQGHGHRATL